MSEARLASTAPRSRPARTLSVRTRALVALVTLAVTVSAPGAASFAAPPGATVPAPVPVPMQDSTAGWGVYHASKKSEGTAIAIEFFLPGFGSLYAGHWQGSLTTWGVSAAGFVSFAWGVSQVGIGDSRSESPMVPLAVLGGLALTVGARIHGLVDSFRSASRYNRGLARRLGLHGGLIVTPMPLHVNGQTTLGLGASWQF
jgi:hypothetical protein